MNIPKFENLRQSVLNDLRNKLGVSTMVGKMFLQVFALVQAAKLKLIYLTAAYIYRNIYPDTADSETLGGTLERFGIVKLGRYPNPPTAGKYQIQVTGEAGATIPANSTLKSLDTSTSPDKMFVIDDGFTFDSPTGLVTIRALELGMDSLLEVDDQLQFTQPIANVNTFVTVNSFVTVTSVIEMPTAGETIEEYRQSVLDAYQIESQGGAKGDYVLWADDVSGVRRVYPYVAVPGILDIYVEATESDSIDGNGVPASAMLTEVKNAVKFDPETGKARAPIGIDEINTIAVNIVPVVIEITDLSDAGLQNTIEENVKAFLKNIRPFRAGVDNPRDANKNKLYLADMYDIVRTITGTDESFEKVDMKVNETEVDVYTFDEGNIPYLENINLI